MGARLALPLISLQWLEDWTPSHVGEDGPPLTIPEEIAIAVTLGGLTTTWAATEASASDWRSACSPAGAAILQAPEARPFLDW